MTETVRQKQTRLLREIADRVAQLQEIDQLQARSRPAVTSRKLMEIQVAAEAKRRVVTQK